MPSSALKRPRAASTKSPSHPDATKRKTLSNGEDVDNDIDNDEMSEKRNEMKAVQRLYWECAKARLEAATVAREESQLARQLAEESLQQAIDSVNQAKTVVWQAQESFVASENRNENALEEWNLAMKQEQHAKKKCQVDDDDDGDDDTIRNNKNMHDGNNDNINTEHERSPKPHQADTTTQPPSVTSTLLSNQPTQFATTSTSPMTPSQTLQQAVRIAFRAEASSKEDTKCTPNEEASNANSTEQPIIPISTGKHSTNTYQQNSDIDSDNDRQKEVTSTRTTPTNNAQQHVTAEIIHAARDALSRIDTFIARRKLGIPLKTVRDDTRTAASDSGETVAATSRTNAEFGIRVTDADTTCNVSAVNIGIASAIARGNAEYERRAANAKKDNHNANAPPQPTSIDNMSAFGKIGSPIRSTTSLPKKLHKKVKRTTTTTPTAAISDAVNGANGIATPTLNKISSKVAKSTTTRRSSRNSGRKSTDTTKAKKATSTTKNRNQTPKRNSSRGPSRKQVVRSSNDQDDDSTFNIESSNEEKDDSDWQDDETAATQILRNMPFHNNDGTNNNNKGRQLKSIVLPLPLVNCADRTKAEVRNESKVEAEIEAKLEVEVVYQKSYGTKSVEETKRLLEDLEERTKSNCIKEQEDKHEYEDTQCLKTLCGHTCPVLAVACVQMGESDNRENNSNKKLVLSASGDKEIKLWEISSSKHALHDYKCINTYAGHSKAVWAVATIEDDNKFISGSSDESVLLWDLHTGECCCAFVGHTGAISSVSNYGGNGSNTSAHSNGKSSSKKFLSGSWDNTVKLWDYSTWECVRTFYGHENAVHAVASLFGNVDNSSKSIAKKLGDDEKIISGSHDCTIKVWNASTGDCLNTLKGHTDAVMALAVIDGNHFLSGSADRTIKYWSIASSEICSTGPCIRTFTGHLDIVNSVAMIGTRTNRKTKRSTEQTPARFVSSSNDKTVKLWCISSETCIRSLHGHTDWVVAAQPVGDDQLLTGSFDRTLRLWATDDEGA